ncbi:MAG: RIP metalloprotease RseP [Omnitrophica WOR_2 bacterium GWF2_43_52]|nr:MAG: RIP metalloprotease RseP [Omnitrophica WOR_2 bacterium GWA2_44_7]OGX14109.1 MAG: RIP metalloprotease RseP [Omnitrophica WOR_2 bacterium GWC2_44_8]OGX21951.1 MAG: RIP metalloprotease RseP [Omnitrophica WOR_2 bacterium GWF2_43_52]OGX55795.1 MAG: RIP metalloprotease RseP [Omnitrophica WOR_2 bacterium RIFOXYC2_FULL_43_9]HAH20040.1 RIP metalloprotease RseP [Candidatus Omnitrophota bacterium]
MFSLLIFIAILSIMIVVHEFGHFIVARKLGIRVENFSMGFGPKLLKYKKGFTEYSLCLIPFGGYVKLSGDSWEECKSQSHEFLSRKPIERAGVIFAGPLLNYLLAFVCFWLVHSIGYPQLTTKVGDTIPELPARSAGIVKEDVIISVDGKPVRYFSELQNIIYTKRASEVELEILRNNEKIRLPVGLQSKVKKNILGVERRINVIGVIPIGEAVFVKQNFFGAFEYAGKSLWELTSITVQALFRLFTGSMPLRESVTGPLGMFYITSEAVKMGINAVLHLMAVLSVSLCIFNLLPFPVLDGGHLFFLGLEKLRGRHLNQKIEEKIHRVGFSLIICLAVFVFLNDVINFGVWEKITRILSKLK